MFKFKNLLGIVVLGVFLLVGFIFFITSDAEAGNHGNSKNCEELVVGDWYYVCENKISNSEEVQPNWELYFTSNGYLGLTQISGTEGQFSRTFGCQCKSTGSFNNPKFDTSNMFHCTTRTGSIALALEGHVVANGDAIIQGEAVNGNGISWVYECWRVYED